MEQIIAKLLIDFENGKMNRRQLIQSLAVSAAAAVAATPALGAAPAAGKGFKANNVNHISFGVADYGRARDFYTDLLGMKVTKDDGKQAFLDFGQTRLLVRKTRQPDNKPLVDHMAYTIENWNREAVEAELKHRGLDPRPDTDYSFHIKDPDGYDVQICGRWPLA
jgi:catechol 2,3-dioxygenase-like lactoylglutathione lyase family enzyme